MLVDPAGLPGIYMARILATLNTLSSANASRLAQPVVRKSPLEENKVPPCIQGVVTSSKGNATVTSSDGGALKVSAGECRQELPVCGLWAATTSHKGDLLKWTVLFPLRKETVFRLTHFKLRRLR